MFKRMFCSERSSGSRAESHAICARDMSCVALLAGACIHSPDNGRAELNRRNRKALPCGELIKVSKIRFGGRDGSVARPLR